MSDAENRFSPQQYSCTYLITSGISFVCFLIVLPFSGYNSEVILSCFSYMFFKFCETFSMYSFSYLQLANKYFKIAVSYCLKGIFPLFVFSLFLYFVHNLWLSLGVMSLIYLLIIIFFDLKEPKGFFPLGIKIKGTGLILRLCFPMMLSSLVLPFMFFLTRHTVQSVFDITELGYYSAFTMVITVFSTMIGAFYVVLIPKISKNYMRKMKAEIVQIIFIMLGIIFGASLIAILLSHLIGNWAFSLIFGISILPYMYLLFPVIITSIMLAVMTFLSTCLIAMQKRLFMLISMLAGVLLLCALVVPITKSYGMLCTTNILTISFAFMIIIQSVIILYTFLSEV